jgi:LSD1 subclass zinc finger protein
MPRFSNEIRTLPYGIAAAARSPLILGSSWLYSKESMIPKDLLDILVCPACRNPLALKGGDESLKCNSCRRVYPIRDNIPILLVDEASSDPS